MCRTSRTHACRLRSKGYRRSQPSMNTEKKRRELWQPIIRLLETSTYGVAKVTVTVCTAKYSALAYVQSSSAAKMPDAANRLPRIQIMFIPNRFWISLNDAAICSLSRCRERFFFKWFKRCESVVLRPPYTPNTPAIITITANSLELSSEGVWYP